MKRLTLTIIAVVAIIASSYSQKRIYKQQEQKQEQQEEAETLLYKCFQIEYVKNGEGQKKVEQIFIMRLEGGKIKFDTKDPFIMHIGQQMQPVRENAVAYKAYQDDKVYLLEIIAYNDEILVFSFVDKENNVRINYWTKNLNN